MIHHILFSHSDCPLRYIQECLYELSENPVIQDRLRKELLDFETEVGRAPVYEEIMSAHALPYLDAVVREACRTKAVLMEISRVVSKTLSVSSS